MPGKVQNWEKEDLLPSISLNTRGFLPRRSKYVVSTATARATRNVVFGVLLPGPRPRALGISRLDRLDFVRRLRGGYMRICEDT
jgi:hypothetical protein